MERDGVLIFHSIHKVLRAEKVLKEAGVDVRLMPVPRQLSSDCGLALTFPSAAREQAARILKQAGCPWQEVHVREGSLYRRLG